MLGHRTVDGSSLAAFTYVPPSSTSSDSTATSAKDAYSWDIRDEYALMGVDATNAKWTLSDLNAEYAVGRPIIVVVTLRPQICETYPEHVVVPSSVSKSTMIASSRFRSRGRLPVLTYYHKPNGVREYFVWRYKTGISQASICRCSQPLSGFSARCEEDETLMAHIASTNERCGVLYLIDTRYVCVVQPLA